MAEQKRKAGRPAPDYTEWPPVGFVGMQKLQAAAGGVTDIAIRDWVEKGLLPPLQRFAPNRVGLSVDVARAAIAALPDRLAARGKQGGRLTGRALVEKRWAKVRAAKCAPV